MQIDIYLKFIGISRCRRTSRTAEEMAEEEKKKTAAREKSGKVARCMERKKLKDAQEKEDAAHENDSAYERISREDRNEGESFSILRQKGISLKTHAAANGFEKPPALYGRRILADETFERPAGSR